jgi:hypothetical protein
LCNDQAGTNHIFAVDSNGSAESLPVFPNDSSLWQDVVDNFINALNAGESPINTRVPGTRAQRKAQIRSNRYQAQKGLPRPDSLGTDVNGDRLSWEEYPYASSVQGGKGATTRLINRDQNSAHGRALGRWFEGNNVGPGASYYVQEC